MTSHKKLKFDLIAIDCDGTLLDSQKSISEGALEAIGEARSAGIEIILVTGRNLLSLESIVSPLGLQSPFIGCGGAFICDLKTGELIEKHTLPIANTRELILLCRENKTLMYIENQDSTLCEMDADEFWRARKSLSTHRNIVPDLLQVIAEPPLKAMVAGEHEKIQKIFDEIKKRRIFENLVYSDHVSFDILPSGVNKGIALKSVATRLQIDPARIASIGNWWNDMDMFRVSGMSVAMGNAPDEIKAGVDLVAPSNDQGGVAWALRKLIGWNE
jgi:Cof subfamily protein (haloacid dehalogenase superfamily)